ncbi:efflux RND transporter periplasmic adaptor subunit [Thermosynechococcus sp. HN-54]|uniref:efflux RND transporter periplasmic adaptor subunit n=1 Tax=Thermosynechococcus sp. HN-54 TaxID=2933959 RepID=UPI00202CF164|nr:efflux RND transporter periplasmic adaptor subunit [Thermosynechococcus sp. HN-54]URR36320.1 efflux RND transporter periplasmic adaptor subunit [Thermosynechococcus sp. HN-54]
MVQRQLLTSTLLGSLCFLTTACGQPRATPPPPVARVKLAAVQTQPLSQTVVYNASLQSRESITLQPQVSGRIVQINVQSGQVVSQGQPLILIDPSEQQAVVASNLAAIQSAQANVENARSILRALEAQRRANLATLEFNRMQAERYTLLFEEGAVSKEQAQSFITSFRTAQADLQQTEADIRAQQATIAQLEKALLAAQANAQQQAVVLNWFQVRAPFSGVIGNIPPKVGDFVTPQTNLLTLTSNQPLEVYIQVPIEQVPRIRRGTPVELLDPNGNVVGTSSVFFIAPNTTNNTQTILVKALYDNTRNNLRADQQIQARIILDQQPGILVPTTAVSNLAGQNFVFVAEKDAEGKMIAKQKPIHVGAIQGNSYQVFKGLQPGEQIVISGIQRLRDGVPITPES